MTALIFIISLAALVIGVLMFMAAGMADETGQDSPTCPLGVAILGLTGVMVCAVIWAERFAHWVMT